MEELTVMSKFYTINSCVLLVYITVSLIFFVFLPYSLSLLFFCYCCSTYTSKNNDHRLLLSTISASFFSVFVVVSLL